MSKVKICTGLKGKKKPCIYHRNGWCDYFRQNGLAKMLMEKFGTTVKCDEYEEEDDE